MRRSIMKLTGSHSAWPVGRLFYLQIFLIIHRVIILIQISLFLDKHIQLSSPKGTVSVILIEPARKCPIHNGTFETFIWSIIFLRLCRFSRTLIVFNFHMFSCRRNVPYTFVKKPQLKIISFFRIHLIHSWSDNAVEGTAVNRALSSLNGG